MSGWISEVGNKSIEDFAAPMGLKMGRLRSAGPCPVCDAPKRGSSDPRGPLGLTPNGKGWKCFRCDASGDTADLLSYKVCGKRIRETTGDERQKVKDAASRLSMTGGFSQKPPLSSVQSIAGIESNDQPKPSGPGVRWSTKLFDECRERIKTTECGNEVSNYLRSRGISDDTSDAFGLGAYQSDDGCNWLAIPLKDITGKVVNFRFRSIPPHKKTYRVCTGRPLPLFGSDMLSSETDKSVIITEGELDTIALYEYGIRSNVVSGTKGAAAKWPDEWLDQLEKYSNFIIAYDDDEAGDSGADKVADKLGRYRCSRAKFPMKDAGECLQSNMEAEKVIRCIDHSESMLDSSLRKVDYFREELEKLINRPDALIGRPTGSLKFDKIVGGMRPGLWVVTGETGHGKTTFCTWLCWEQALLGTPVVLTSFEQRPIGTVQKLLRSQMGGDFVNRTPDERRDALTSLGSLPIYIMDHYGEATSQDIIDSLRYAKRRHGVRVALIDHLGFLTRGKSEGERQRIEEAIRSLAIVSVMDEMTIILVCHPNRTFTSQQRRVQISDLKGASAIEQDAHVGIVVERQSIVPTRGFPATKIYVDKVRSEFGSPGGHILLPFDPLSCVFSDTWEATPSGQAGLRVVSPPT